MRRNVSWENLREAGRSEKPKCKWEYDTKMDTKKKKRDVESIYPA